MCKITSSESKFTVSSLIDMVKSELFTADREKELQSIIDTMFNEFMGLMHEQVKKALSLTVDKDTPDVRTLKFFPSYDYGALVCEVTDVKSEIKQEVLELSQTTKEFFKNELNDLATRKRFISLMFRRFQEAGFENNAYTVDVFNIVQEYING